MTNLFSIFDPTTLFFNLPLNWSSLIFPLILLPVNFWVSSSQVTIFFKNLLNYVHGEFKAIMGTKAVPGSTALGVLLFALVMLSNLLGLLPYVFTPTSHLSITVGLALPLWLGHMVSSWSKQPTFMLSHLIPQGTPFALLPLMVFIELISSLIRPLTLSVRLAANMVAGHLLLSLLSGASASSAYLLVVLILTSLVLMSVLELAVACIQAYVFSALSSLYLAEVDSFKMNK